MLVSSGFADMLPPFGEVGAWSPIVLGWLIAVAVRLATGSATVATITAAGIMPGAIIRGPALHRVDRARDRRRLGILHVNDPGFWLVKSYVGTDTSATFRTWSVLETIISVVGLALIFVLSHVL